MGYLIELDDLRQRIIYPPKYPYPWDGQGREPEVLPVTSESAGAVATETLGDYQTELALVFDERSHEGQPEQS